MFVGRKITWHFQPSVVEIWSVCLEWGPGICLCNRPGSSRGGTCWKIKDHVSHHTDLVSQLWPWLAVWLRSSNITVTLPLHEQSGDHMLASYIILRPQWACNRAALVASVHSSCVLSIIQSTGANSEKGWGYKEERGPWYPGRCR